MNSRSGQRPRQLLRAGLHLLMAALLAVVAARAIADDRTNAVIIAAVMAAVYVGGVALVPVNRSRTIAVIWLAALGAVWLVLLALTADAIWVAFPLFLLQLHLLPPGAAVTAVIATTVIAVVGFAAHQRTPTAAAVIGPVIGAAVAVAGALGYRALYRESEQRRALIEELDAARDQLATAGHAAGVAAERERLAREIHDTLAQGLSSIQLLLRAAERALAHRPDTTVAAEHVERARQTAQDNLAEARRFVRALSPPDLEHASLPAALERLCATTDEHSRLAVTFALTGAPGPLPTPIEAALLRIAQSGLANAIQHANASKVAVTLSYMHRAIALDIVDDGIGFDSQAARAAGADNSFGLLAMRARVQELGGALSLESAPGHGTAVAASFPHPPDPAPRA